MNFTGLDRDRRQVVEEGRLLRVVLRGVDQGSVEQGRQPEDGDEHRQADGRHAHSGRAPRRRPQRRQVVGRPEQQGNERRGCVVSNAARIDGAHERARRQRFAAPRASPTHQADRERQGGAHADVFPNRAEEAEDRRQQRDDPHGHHAEEAGPRHRAHHEGDPRPEHQVVQDQHPARPFPHAVELSEQPAHQRRMPVAIDPGSTALQLHERVEGHVAGPEGRDRREKSGRGAHPGQPLGDGAPETSAQASFAGRGGEHRLGQRRCWWAPHLRKGPQCVTRHAALTTKTGERRRTRDLPRKPSVRYGEPAGRRTGPPSKCIGTSSSAASSRSGP